MHQGLSTSQGSTYPRINVGKSVYDNAGWSSKKLIRDLEWCHPGSVVRIPTKSAVDSERRRPPIPI